MKNINLLILVFFLLTIPSTSLAVERIISTAPSTTEILFSLGLGDYVVGVTNFCNYPEKAKHKAHIGGNLNPDLEKIAMLRPTYIVFLRGNLKLKNFCKKMHIKAIGVKYNSLSDIYNSILCIGKTFGVEDRAYTLIRHIKYKLHNVTSKIDKKSRSKVLIVVYREINRLKDIWVATDVSFLGDILRLCGAKNIINDVTKPYIRISLEEIISRNPDIIIEASSKNLGITSSQSLKLWSRLGKINAVKNKRIYVLSKPYMTIPGPRIPLIAKEFIKCIYKKNICK
ncbi:ABC transporter substrate-binding protein [Desulfothermus okinawensis]